MHRFQFLFVACALLFAASAHSPAFAQDTGPSPQAVRIAERHIQEFEKQVERAAGAPFKPKYEAKEAMRRVAAMKKDFPDDPAVKAMVERIRVALIASRGESFRITPKMVAYREAQQRITSTLYDMAQASWADTLAAMRADGGLIDTPLPAPSYRDTPPDSVIGHAVLLEGLIDYPAREFRSAGRSYLAVGKSSAGYYFVDLSGTGWRSAYSAVREYQRLVSSDTPGPWDMIGRVTGLDLMVPEAGEDTRMSAEFGWVVEPVAIRLPERTVALATDGEVSGGFAGQDRLEALKAESYSVTSVPDDADAIEVLRAYIAAVKERNYDFYVSLVDPDWITTERSEERLAYYWGITQRRLRDLYVHVEPDSVVEELVLQGEKIDDLESAFLTEADQALIAAEAKPLIEQVTVRILRYDARGKQVEPDNRMKLRRKAGGPWRIWGPWPL